MTFLHRIIRLLITLATVAAALFILVQVWDVYMLAPWTRDGRIIAQTVVVAPEVSGTVIMVPLVKNQLVQKGEILFRLDPSRFRIALAQAQFRLTAAALQLRLREANVARRKGLAGLISKEDRQTVDIGATIASATLGGAEAAIDLARLNLARSTVYAPVTGYVTRLRLQAGDYADAGRPVVTLVDAASFQVVAYFEETKLSMIKPGKPARIKLMGYPQILQGHVASIGRGIGDFNSNINALGLPVVNPVFNWVRLAQRIPVDIRIDNVPAGVLLASGMTCSVDISNRINRRNTLSGRVRRWFEDHL